MLSLQGKVSQGKVSHAARMPSYVGQPPMCALCDKNCHARPCSDYTLAVAIVFLTVATAAYVLLVRMTRSGVRQFFPQRGILALVFVFGACRASFYLLPSVGLADESTLFLLLALYVLSPALIVSAYFCQIVAVFHVLRDGERAGPGRRASTRRHVLVGLAAVLVSTELVLTFCIWSGAVGRTAVGYVHVANALVGALVGLVNARQQILIARPSQAARTLCWLANVTGVLVTLTMAIYLGEFLLGRASLTAELCLRLAELGALTALLAGARVFDRADGRLVFALANTGAHGYSSLNYDRVGF